MSSEVACSPFARALLLEELERRLLRLVHRLLGGLLLRGLRWASSSGEGGARENECRWEDMLVVAEEDDVLRL